MTGCIITILAQALVKKKSSHEGLRKGADPAWRDQERLLRERASE